MSVFLDRRYASLSPYVPGEQPTGKKYIKLNTNENPYPPSPSVQRAVEQETGRLNLYSDPTCREVLAPLAEYFGVLPENCFVGNGSDEILAFCFQGFCPGGAAFADLTYGFYPVYSDFYGVDTEILPLQDDFTICVADYKDKKKTIFIANPNAPTGLAISLDDIRNILNWNRKHLVIIDEAYVHFGANSAVPLVQDYDNLLVVGTFSKSRSLAGARLGYAVGNREIIADLEKMKYSFNPYNVNRMTLAAGAASIKDDAYFLSCCERIKNTRERTIKTLRDMNFICTDSLANFLFVRHEKIPGEAVFQYLRECGILVRWFNRPRIKEYLRISIGTEDEMDQLILALKSLEKEKG